MTRVVEVLGAPLTVEWHEAGDGDPPLLWLHGLHGFAGDDPCFAALAKHRRAIAPLHPGYGDTERPDWMDTVQDVAHYYLELLEQLDVHDVTVVGTSLGGWIAAEMAAWRPARVGRLILADALGIRIGGPSDRDIADIFAITREQVAALMVHNPAFASPPPAELSDEKLLRRMRAEETTALYTWQPYMCNPKLRRRLRSVRIPTLVMWGDHDGLTSVDYGRAYAEAFPDARFEVIANAGHYPHLEQPEKFCEHVEAFISTTSAARASTAV